MKELKSKKTGLTQTISDEEYSKMVKLGTIDMNKFVVTDLRSRPIVPSLKIPETNKSKK